MKKLTLNITAGTDVVLNDTLTFQGEVFDPSLSVNVEANLISGLGKRSALSFEIEDTHMIIDVPWEEGRLTGCYGLEVRGVTNGRKWATYSDSLIRYTKATEDGASSVTDEGDVYDITQTVAYRYSVSPIEEITADTDGLTGTPSVSVDYDGKDIAFHFDGIKGEKGDAFTYDDFTPEELESLRGPQGPKGNDGVVLDPEAVTIFNSPSDLVGKTDEQKATMIPNGLAYGQSVGDTTALTNSVAVILSNESLVTPLNGWIKVSGGSWVASNNMRTWQITNANYTRLVAHVRNSDTEAFAISFYNSSTISAASRISGTAFSGTDWDDFDVPVPNGTQLICVTTRSTYISDSYFNLYGLKVGEVQSLDGRVTSLETTKAVEPFYFSRYMSKYGWNNSDQWDYYANLVGDPYKHELAPYLVDGKLVIINTYTGENQIKCKIPWFTASGGGNSYNAWTVLQQGENVFTPRANSVYFSICLGMNNSGGTEIDGSDISLYEGCLYYKRANTNPQQITENIGSIKDIENRLDIMDNFGNPLYVGGGPLVYDKVYFGRPLRFGKRYKRVYYNISTGGNQGGAVYNGLLFTFKGDHSKCFIVDMNTKSLLQTISLTAETNFHCNCVNFGIEKADSSDEFPLLYVDGYYTKTCYVYRITGDRGSFVLTKVQTITYPSTWNHPEMFIDRDAETMWVLDDQTNNVTFKRMAIPALSAGDVTLSADNVLDEVNIGATPVTQAGSIFNGDLYFSAGYTGEGVVYVIDLYVEKRIVTKINYGYEPQTPLIWDGNLYVLESGQLDLLYLT